MSTKELRSVVTDAFKRTRRQPQSSKKDSKLSKEKIAKIEEDIRAANSGSSLSIFQSILDGIYDEPQEDGSSDEG